MQVFLRPGHFSAVFREDFFCNGRKRLVKEENKKSCTKMQQKN